MSCGYQAGGAKKKKTDDMDVQKLPVRVQPKRGAKTDAQKKKDNAVAREVVAAEKRKQQKLLKESLKKSTAQLAAFNIGSPKQVSPERNPFDRKFKTSSSENRRKTANQGGPSAAPGQRSSSSGLARMLQRMGF